jgi:hypothetical protein
MDLERHRDTGRFKIMNHKIGRKGAITVALAGILMLCAFQNGGKISYFQPITVAHKPDTIKPLYVDFKDSTFNDTLYQIRSKEGYPVSYFRKIQASVCFDNKCRLLDIVLYWNITGRYLGFELPEGEFLSKSDHEPFQPEEYKRLHQILADQESPIANFTYEQIALKPAYKLAGVDAISSPTPPAVAEHVVQGAAYTTYKLWHFVYGPTQQQVRALTRKALTPRLMGEILASPDETDKMWALNHINGEIALSPELSRSILALIDDSNYSLAERAVNAINKSDLRAPALQLLLLDKFYAADYSLKKLLIDKIKEAPELSDQVKNSLAKNLHQLNGEILRRVLDAYKRHHVQDKEILRKVSALLQHENSFISRKAFDFFQQVEVKDQEINTRISKYKLKHGY